MAGRRTAHAPTPPIGEPPMAPPQQGTAPQAVPLEGSVAAEIRMIRAVERAIVEANAVLQKPLQR